MINLSCRIRQKAEDKQQTSERETYVDSSSSSLTCIMLIISQSQSDTEDETDVSQDWDGGYDDDLSGEDF